MNVSQDELNSFRTLTAKIKQTGSCAMRSVGHDQRVQIEEVTRLAAQLETRLEMAGAARPASIAPAFTVSLSLLDTQANREYREALRVAWEAGLKVDRERYGESIGTDGCAGAVELILADVEEEINRSSAALRE